MPCLGIFRLEFQKTFVIFEISTFEFVKNELLTHTKNFGMESAFSKGPGSSFSEDSGLGPGPHIKYAVKNYIAEFNSPRVQGRG